MPANCFRKTISMAQLSTSDKLLVNQRRAHRYSIIDREIVAVSIGAGRTSGLMIDVSEEGMGVQAFMSLPSGTQEQLRWKFPDEDRWIIVTGEIAWSNTTDLTGIKFVNLSEDDRARILRHLRPTSTAPESCNGVMTGQTDVTTELHYLVERAKTLTCARGVAIAIASGDEFVCRASAGVAPSPGVALQTDRGLSAECLRTGDPVYCDDTDDDPRVDAELCRELGLRSAIVVPVKSDARVIGVILCHWNRRIAYTEHDLRQLTAIADCAARLFCPPVQLWGDQLPRAGHS
jgi:putative methionine-R-sulfoxide reductase with GAF domain